MIINSFEGNIRLFFPIIALLRRKYKKGRKRRSQWCAGNKHLLNTFYIKSSRTNIWILKRIWKELSFYFVKISHSSSSILTNITKSCRGQGAFNRIFNWPFGLLGGHIGIMLAPRARGCDSILQPTLNIFSKGYYATHLIHIIL